MRLTLIVLSLFAALGCTGGGSTSQIRAFDTLDPCTSYDEGGCSADDRCQWIAIGAPCVEGEPCKSGVCQQIDPCRGYTDEGACASDSANHCAWAATELCPAENCGDGGYCYQVTEDEPCACACPVCDPAEGQECPPCECSCPSDECVCSGSVCPDNDPSCVPEPFECSCPAGDGGGCGDGSVPPEPL